MKFAILDSKNFRFGVRQNHMPTIEEIDGFRFLFYSDEGNERCHIQVRKGGGNAKIWLLPELEEQYYYGFTVSERRKIRQLVEEKRSLFISKWNEYFKR